MRIAILGAGGVGGYFGGRLAVAGEDVQFIARGAHLAALRERGLRIESPDGHFHLPHVAATDDPSTIGPVDIVFFTVKLYDTESAIAMLPPLLGPHTLVIPLQNGVDAVDRLVEAVGASHVAGGTTYVISTVAEPGLIRHTGAHRLIVGSLDGAPATPLARLCEAGRRAGYDAVLSNAIQVNIWTKFISLTAFSGMTSIARCAIGPVREDPDLRAMMEAAWREAVLVARAKGVPLPDGIFSQLQTGLAGMPADAKSSMLWDLERGRPLELPWLSGAVVRIGRELGVDTPTHRLMVALLAPHAKGR